MRRARENKDYAKVISIFESFPDWSVSPDKECYSFVLDMMGQIKCESRAHRLLGEMIEDKLFPDANDYNSVLNTFADCGDSEKLTQFMHLMRRNYVSMNERTTQLFGRGYFIAGDVLSLKEIIHVAENNFRRRFDTTQMREDLEVLRVDQLV